MQSDAGRQRSTLPSRFAQPPVHQKVGQATDADRQVGRARLGVGSAGPDRLAADVGSDLCSRSRGGSCRRPLASSFSIPVRFLALRFRRLGNLSSLSVSTTKPSKMDTFPFFLFLFLPHILHTHLTQHPRPFPLTPHTQTKKTSCLQNISRRSFLLLALHDTTSVMHMLQT